MDAYSPKDVLPLLGGPRVAIVLNAADNAEEALEACAWELDLGQALLKPIGLAEVIVRNSIDSAINQWWMAQDLENTWTRAPIYIQAPPCSLRLSIAPNGRREPSSISTKDRRSLLTMT